MVRAFRDEDLSWTVRVQIVHRVLDYILQILNTEPWPEMEKHFVKLFGILKSYERSGDPRYLKHLRLYLEHNMEPFIQGNSEHVDKRWNRILHPHARARLSPMYNAAMRVHAGQETQPVQFESHPSMPQRRKGDQAVKYRHCPSVTPIRLGTGRCRSILDYPIQ